MIIVQALLRSTPVREGSECSSRNMVGRAPREVIHHYFRGRSTRVLLHNALKPRSALYNIVRPRSPLTVYRMSYRSLSGPLHK